MQDVEAQLLRSLLTETRVLSLAVLVDGAPLVGLLPFVVKPDLSGAVVHASRLARHTRGLVDGAPYGLLVHGPDAPGGDPLQVARLSLEGEVRALPREHPDHPAADALYRGRFPTSAPTFELADFGLYELVFRRGRLVGGFARAINLDEDALRKVAGG